MSTNTLGSTIDALYMARARRLALTKEVDELKAHETALRNQISGMLAEVGLQKASGEQATCGITSKIEPVIVDWEKIHGYIRNQNRFDLLQKRLSGTAWRDLIDTGFLVPGTEQITVYDLSLTKSTR